MGLHEVGRIQPVGALIAYDARTETICAASENTDLFMKGLSWDKALEQSIEKSLDGKVLHALRNAAALPSLNSEPEPLGVFDFKNGSLDIRAHQREHLIIVELMPSKTETTALRLVKDLSRLAYSANCSTAPAKALQDIVKLLRLMSGYERAQLSRFTSEGCRQVVVDTNLAHHDEKRGTPSSLSFSKTNRALNFVADVSVDPIRIMGSFPGPIDTKYCQFVFPHPATLTRLFKRKLRAELTQPIYLENQLWGQLVLQNQVPQVPTARFKYMLQCAMPVIQNAVARLDVRRNLV